MTLSGMAPAIVAVAFAGAGYAYALLIRRRLRKELQEHPTPAE